LDTSDVAFSLDSALQLAMSYVSAVIPEKKRVAVAGISSIDTQESNYAGAELLRLLSQSNRWVILDDRGLEAHSSREGLYGTIDEKAVRDMGYLLGADIVFFGDITPYGRYRYLTLRVMDMKNGDIITTTTEKW
jgi:hypothetical protein